MNTPTKTELQTEREKLEETRCRLNDEWDSWCRLIELIPTRLLHMRMSANDLARHARQVAARVADILDLDIDLDELIAYRCAAEMTERNLHGARLLMAAVIDDQRIRR